MKDIDDVLADLDETAVTLLAGDRSLSCSVLQNRPLPRPVSIWDDEVDFILVTKYRRADFQVLDGVRHMTLYSQRDPSWRNLVYSEGATFGEAGCYVTAVAMMASLAGYKDAPPEVARKLQEVGAFSGPFLSRPRRIPDAYPLLEWDGSIDWRNSPADLDRLRADLEQGPLIIEVEFRPGGARPPMDQHFVVAEGFTEDGTDLVVVDPWDGTRTRLLGRYALKHWNLTRAVYGARRLHVAST